MTHQTTTPTGDGRGLLHPLGGEGGYFLMPNRIVDRDLQEIKTRGLAMYALLARQPARWQYPGPYDLALQLGVSQSKAEGLLDKLRQLELINDHDLRAIREGR